jgi:deferrochelatase/peroxidase EfeB
MLACAKRDITPEASEHAGRQVVKIGTIYQYIQIYVGSLKELERLEYSAMSTTLGRSAYSGIGREDAS